MRCDYQYSGFVFKTAGPRLRPPDVPSMPRYPSADIEFANTIAMLHREKSSLRMAKPFSPLPSEVRSTRKTRAGPLTRMIGFIPVREGRATST